MLRLLARVIIVAALYQSSISAIDVCKRSIINGFSNIPECYKDGVVPAQLGRRLEVATLMVMSTPEVPPGLCCVTGYQDQPYTQVTFNYRGFRPITHVNIQINKGRYLLEIDKDGIRYRIYVIKSESGVYGYYRCVEDRAYSTGTDMITVMVHCDYVNSPQARAVLQEIKTCFNRLKITDYKDITPCPCPKGNTQYCKVWTWSGECAGNGVN